MITGTCYCKAVSFTVDDSPVNGISCLCDTCQILHSQNSYNIQSEVSKLKIVKGTPKVYLDDKADSGKPIHRSFCGDCGSALFSIPEMAPGALFVKVGCLDKNDKKNIKLVASIYQESAIPHSIADKTVHEHKQYEGFMAKEI